MAAAGLNKSIVLAPCMVSRIINRHHHKYMRYLITILFLLVVLAGCSRKLDISQRDLHREQRDILLHAQSEALEAKIVLTELRDGHLTNALELLEMQIDTSVILIDHSLPSLSAPERDEALSTLRLLRAYRKAHPRQREAAIQDADKQDRETVAQASQKASRILNDLR